MVPGAPSLKISILWKRIGILFILFSAYQVVKIYDSTNRLEPIDLVKMGDGSRQGILVKSFLQILFSLLSDESSIEITLGDYFTKEVIDSMEWKFFEENNSVVIGKNLTRCCYEIFILFKNTNTSFSSLLTGPWKKIHESEIRRPHPIAMAFAMLVLFIFLVLFVTLFLFIISVISFIFFVKIE